MAQKRWHMLRGFVAVVFATGLFTFPVAAGVIKSGIDSTGLAMVAVFYLVYAALVFWLFGRPLT